MQMVALTKSFIRKPFVVRSITRDAWSHIGNSRLVRCFSHVEINFPDLGILNDKILIGSIIVRIGFGILITWMSTYFATQRFLNLRTDELY
jgi:cell division transport system permease protein